MNSSQLFQAVSSLAAVLVATQAFGQSAARQIVTDAVYVSPQKLVDVDHGRRMNLFCLGRGSPSVILDAGLGDSTRTWGLVQPAVSKKTRVCSYDRAGIGYSDAATRPSTASNIADDLHALLVAAHIRPPYILVGHSSAGLSLRVFADRYIDEIGGMVLVDPSHEDQWFRGWAIGAPGQKERFDASLAQQRECIGAAEKGFVKDTPAYKQCMSYVDPYVSQAINDAQRTIWATPGWQAAFLSEMESATYVSSDQARATRKNFGDMPLIVLTHAPHAKAANETQEEGDKRTLLWEDLHSQLAAMSTRGINVIVPNSGHYIQFDRPQVVVDAVKQAIDLSKEKRARSRPSPAVQPATVPN